MARKEIFWIINKVVNEITLMGIKSSGRQVGETATIKLDNSRLSARLGNYLVRRYYNEGAVSLTPEDNYYNLFVDSPRGCTPSHRENILETTLDDLYKAIRGFRYKQGNKKQ